MKFRVNFNPVFFTANTKKELLEKIYRGHGIVFSSYASNCLIPIATRESYLRVFNIEKRRKKVNRFSKNGKSYSKVLSPNHWVGYVYTIPVETLITSKRKVVQHTRFFDIVKT
jgi:hypothetical protein